MLGYSGNIRLSSKIMPLQCYVDESSDGDGNHTAVMAGYVAPLDTWLEFTDDWGRVLQEQNKIFLHSSNNIFKKLGSKRNAEQFYRVIEKHLDYGFCVTVNISNYRNLISSCKFPKSLEEADGFNKLWDPYIFMYQAFFELSLHEKHKLGLSGPVDFIFDETAKYKDIITRSFKYTFFFC